MTTDEPSGAPEAGFAGTAVPPPLEVEGGAPRGPDHNSPIDPGMPPTDADGATPAEAGAETGADTGAESRGPAGRVGAPEPRPRGQ